MEKRISSAVIHRMPRYFRHLCDLQDAGIARISSGTLADRMGLTASQVRQDFNCFGGFGQQGYGYNVAELRSAIAGIMHIDRERGAIIVGTGLQAISNERNILRDYYDNTRERGFDYAYTYPAINRVLQAAGRVIRRESDRGVIILIDDRYGTPQMTNLLPEHWKNLQYAGNALELAEIVEQFWLDQENF